MKTIVNKLRFALLLGFIAIGMTALAQNIANIEKMSISTQMILNEIENGVSLDIKPDLRGNGLAFNLDPEKQHRTVARPVSINGETFISAFIRINDESEINDLKALGVQIECKFDNGLLTALIPVDKIHKVAALEGVKKINAATLMKPLTDKTREKTNVDDVLTQSPDAIAAGLDKVYDGSGVILGIIDDGIDYQHIAFKDKDGNNRISRIYNFTYTQTDNYGRPTDPTAIEWNGSGTMPTTDDNSADHGTHTSSIAGGSSVIINGTNVMVTDDHANATYGGMAPGAELYLAGIKGLYDTYIANAFQKMYQYATAQNKPLVVSNSWGSQIGPHDGTGSFAEITHNYFSDSHPNNICLFAAGNEAGTADASEGGGFHISGNASSASPLGTILRCSVSSSYDNGLFYIGELASAWSNTNLGCKIYVLNTSTGAIETTVNVNPTTQGAAVSGLSNYYSGTLYAYKDYLNSENKTQILLYATGTNGYMQSQSYTQSGGMYRSNYTLAVEFYPINGSADIDVWAVSDYNYFTNYLTTNGHNWTNGSDDMSVDDEVTYPDVISVGAYNSKTSFVNYQGSTYGANSYILNDITYFSSYATPEESPTGVQYPWITAPGALIVSAVNHNHTSSVDDDSYYGSSSLVVNSTTNPYAIMQGTSMACPAAAGIVALWMQAAQEVGKTLTTTDIKNIMAETAIKDSWVTSGANASHFGNGKINALGGIEYILNEYGEPTITATPSTVTFEGAPGGTYTQTVTVGGIQLTNDIIAELNDQTGTYSINRATNLGSGGDLVITYAPTGQGNHNATITLTSNGATPKTITINGTSRIVTEATVADGNNTNSYLPIYGNQYSSKQINQMIYPESMLSEIQGKKIKSMKFYPTTPLNFYGGAFTVKMGTTTQTTYPQSNYSRITANMQTVKTGQVAVRNDAELVITFDEPFEYNSGNLVIDFEVTTTGTKSTSQNFYGVNQNNTYRAFNSYGSSINNYGRYGNGSRRAFLPKVTFEWDAPFVAGEVSPSSLTFSDAIIGDEATQTVTVTNTGNMPFTPVIDTTNLPAEFTVTGSGVVAIGGDLNLTVTYSPTNEGPHSGSFTVTIGDQTYTVSVTGNGITVNSTLFSNEVMVPVYHSEAEVDYSTYIFSESEVLGDVNMGLAYPSGSAPGEVKVLANSDEHILNYELHHKVGNGNWTYPNGNAVATANHVGNSYVVNDNTFTFPQDATEMWITMNDSQLSTAMTTYYIPVTMAKSIVETGSQDNTYGAPVVVSASDGIDLEVFIDGFKSASKDKYGNYTGIWKEPYGTDSINYCVYMPQVHVVCQQLGALRPYMYRAWLLANDDITYYNFAHHPQTGFYGTTPITNLPKLLAERSIEDVSDPTHVLLPEELGDTYEGMNTFGAPVNVLDVTDNPNNPGIVIAVRVYYQSADEENGHMLRGNRDGGFGFGEGRGSGNGIPTAIDELFGYGKQVVDVQYVNALGMQSKEPFDGLNIVVTRYSDGSITTTKVIK